MFLAYGSVHYSLYSAYEKYALMTPGSIEACAFAQNLFSPEDEVAKEFNEILFSAARNSTFGIVEEYRVFCVRAADGENFDIYLVDEDQLFMASTPGVAEADVLTEGMNLMRDWKSFDRISFVPTQE